MSMQLVYTHTFPPNLIAGRADQHTVHFIMPGERATMQAARRIADAVSRYAATPLDDNGARYIKARLLKATEVRQYDDGTWALMGDTWGSVGAEVVQA